MPRAGFEPATLRLPDNRSYLLSYDFSLEEGVDCLSSHFPYSTSSLFYRDERSYFSPNCRDAVQSVSIWTVALFFIVLALYSSTLDLK
uniref:Uncharacterized protein n=1 Tax=Anguilla anguilla TaxID=7936 RepID=A0A0E9UBC8_ANGAN